MDKGKTSSDQPTVHKAGFVNIIGFPNVGKSTLMNALVGEKMSIITHKPQTTRHRILGIWNDDGHQIVFSDSPGLITEPRYRMQDVMNSYVYSAFEDADVLIYLVDVSDQRSIPEGLLRKIKQLSVPVFLVLNKLDKVKEEVFVSAIQSWEEVHKFDQIFGISALEKKGIDNLLSKLKSEIPESPPYFPKDQLTDKSERFIVSEMIRGQILELYHQEVPYSCDVVVTGFKKGSAKKGEIIRISADIYVSRKSQKSIIIGKGGVLIKNLGVQSRKAIEDFFETNIYLELFVKVKENWRDDDRLLRHLGYH